MLNLRRFTLAALGATVLPWLQAQVPVRDAAEVQKALDKLQVVGSVLYLAAHPDDENTAVLATLSKGWNLRTAYLALNRGGGGQNLIGAELGEGLAAIRTQELLAARRIDGAEQFFTSAVDFGFSKTAEESLRIWNHDKVLGEVVRTLRTFRPDVILTRFPPDERGGHGHHTASALLAIEAFQAAADPTRPEHCGYQWETLYAEIKRHRMPSTEDLKRMAEAFRNQLRGWLVTGQCRGLVVEDQGRVVASVLMLLKDTVPTPVTPLSVRGYLFNVYTDPAFRRKGLAARLTDAALDLAREIGIEIMELHASLEAEGLYQRMGFAPTSEMRLVMSAGIKTPKQWKHRR